MEVLAEQPEGCRSPTTSFFILLRCELMDECVDIILELINFRHVPLRVFFPHSLHFVPYTKSRLFHGVVVAVGVVII